MTIKKIKTAAKPAASAEVADMPQGGATIADRFKLDTPDAAALKAASVSKKAATYALTAALIALAVAGVLTYVLYTHWDFLMRV